MRYVRYGLYIGLVLLLTSCGKSTTTAPSDFTITGPAASTDIFSTITPQTPGSSVNYTLNFLVKDLGGKPRQGVDVTFLLISGRLYSDNTFTSAVTTPYKIATNDSGVATAYVKVTSPACAAAADATYTVTLSALLTSISTQWTDTVTVKKCGT